MQDVLDFLRKPRVRIFALTFWCYGSLHITRKAFSGSKPSLKSEYGLSEARPDLHAIMFFTAIDAHHAALLLRQDQLAYLDTAFLSCYAVGMLALGHIGDHINPARIVSTGLFGTCLLYTSPSPRDA